MAIAGIETAAEPMQAFTAGPMGSLAGVHAPGDGSMRDIDRDGGAGFLALLEERVGRVTDSDRDDAADANEVRSRERVLAGSRASGSRGVEDEETGVGGRVRRALARVKESAEDAMKQGERVAAGAGSDEGAGPEESGAPATHGMADGGEPLMTHGKRLSLEAHASAGASADGGAGTGALGELGEGAEAAAAHTEEQEQGPEGTGGERRGRLSRSDGSGIETEQVERAASGQAQGAGELNAGERGTDSLHSNGAGVAADRDRAERAEAGERRSGVTARGEGRVGESKLVVVDLRSERQRREAATDRSRTAEARRSAAVRDQAVRRGLETELEARVVVRSGGGEAREGSPAESPRGAAHEVRTPVPSRFQQALRSEVVRHSTMILRNDGQGELRLILKPESLGQVRIRLSMNNNHIEGRIIVENSTVKDMFDSNLAHLSQAFEKEGFSSASLEVAVGHKGERREGRQDGPAASVHHEEQFDKNLAVLDDPERETRLVNITV